MNAHPDHPTRAGFQPRWQKLTAAVLLASLLSACSSPARRTEPDMRPPSTAVQPPAAKGPQCLPEGQLCAGPGVPQGATCCAGSSCAHIGKRVCILDY